VARKHKKYKQAGMKNSSRSKSHHWWPKCNQLYWSDNDHVTNIRISEVGTLKVMDTSRNNTACINGLNSFESDGESNDIFEKLLSQIDSDAAVCFKSLKRQIDCEERTTYPILLADGDRRRLAKYVSSMLFRPPTYRQNARRSRSEKADSANLLDTIIKTNNVMSELLGKTIQNERSFDIQHHAILSTSMMMNLFALLIYNAKLKFILYPCPAGTGSLNVLVADLARR
jgi:hypothetical protein